MEKVILDKDVYEKLIRTVANMPYAQVAQIMGEATESAQLVQAEPEETEIEDGD